VEEVDVDRFTVDKEDDPEATGPDSWSLDDFASVLTLAVRLEDFDEELVGLPRLFSVDVEFAAEVDVYGPEPLVLDLLEVDGSSGTFGRP